MRRRRRYEVVVEGLSGQAASQRSVISEHRSEADAREDASLERARLEVIYGDAARSWRILVVRDDEVIGVETPHGGEEPRRRAAERAPRSQPLPQAEEPLPEVEEPLPEVEESVVVIRPEALHDPAPEPHEDGSAADASHEPPAPEPDRPGRVPDWVITRVEESIARQRDRSYGSSSRDEDDAPGR